MSVNETDGIPFMTETGLFGLDPERAPAQIEGVPCCSGGQDYIPTEEGERLYSAGNPYSHEYLKVRRY